MCLFCRVCRILPILTAMKLTQLLDPMREFSPYLVCLVITLNSHIPLSASFMYPDSVTASILEYRTIQGRTYHSDRYASEYVMPNDEQQLQSVDISHHYLTMLLDNNLFLAPIPPHVQRVLDVGTGSGIWAMQVSLPTSLFN